MEVETRRVPVETHCREQTADQGLEVGDNLLVVNLMDGYRQNCPPVVHEPQVALEIDGDLARVVGPGDVAEVGHPAREGHVPQVAAAMDDGGGREHPGE